MLKGKTAFITGGGRGIGRATAVVFAKNGAKVLVCSRSKEELDETVAQAGSAGADAEGYVCDISKESDIVNTFSSVGSKHGTIDILVNNAGLFVAGALETMSSDDFRKVIEINSVGMFLCCREAFKLMKNGGAIVNISSLAGIRSVEKFPGFSSYVVSKYGVVGLTEALAVEWKEHGIRSNCIAPGAVDTEMLQKAAPDLQPRITPEEVAETILFLSSERSSGINGSTLEMFSSLKRN